MTTLRKKQIQLIIVAASIVVVVAFLYPTGSKLLQDVRSHSQTQSFSFSKSFIAKDMQVWDYRVQYERSVLSSSGVQPSILTFARNIFWTPSVPAVPQTVGAQAIPVLLYHGILPVSNSPDVTSISTFEAQMFALKAAGWHTITIEQFVSAMQGKTILPAKSFLITFDDGRKDAYENADPIFEALGYNAVMFVITGHSLAPGNEKSTYYLSEAELEQMQASGRWELQSHSDIGHKPYPINAQGTLGDFYGDNLWIPSQNPGESDTAYQQRLYSYFDAYFTRSTPYPLVPGQLETESQYENRVETDLLNSKLQLELGLGSNVLSFAYPFNDFGDTLKPSGNHGQPTLVSIVNQIYPVSFYQFYPSLGNSENYPGDGQLLKRITPAPDWTPAELLSVLNAGQAKQLPYTMSNSGQDGWQEVYGNIVQNKGTLLVSSTDSLNEASGILDGTGFWKNYEYSVGLNWLKGQNVSLIGHYQANALTASYLKCSYSNGVVGIENDSDSGSINNSVITEVNNSNVKPGNNEKLGMILNGNTISCLWDGQTVASSPVATSSPTKGGVGIAIWDPAVNIAQVIVTSVNVKSL